MNKLNLQGKLKALATPAHLNSLRGIKRGIEREALRIKPSGEIAKTPHPKGAGHALTHGAITTDFSESLLEFITPVSESPEETLAQLKDLQKYTLSHMGDELLWPMSMPCYIKQEDDIVLAQFGQSNIGRMKTLYREGLKNRYGSMMQAIAGVHFNISFPDSLWQSLQQLEHDTRPLQDFVSAQYLGLIRNFKRELWLISYLFGASPALCNSFLQGKNSQLPFKELGQGTLYLEHGTALRLGDLGYTNSAQSSLRVTYNSLDEYIIGLQKAIRCRSDLYDHIPDYQHEAPKQLNKNILQIENEFYSPIRPKRNGRSGETPTQALSRGGIEYVEIRALDVNPFSETGIDLDQILFLDVFLSYCLLKDSPELSWDEQQTCDANLQQVINEGRNPQVKLQQNGEARSLQHWGEDIFAQLSAVAALMDEAQGSQRYAPVIAKLHTWVTQPELTLSGRIIASLVEQDQDSGELALLLAERYKHNQAADDYQTFDSEKLDAMSAQSFLDEKDVVAADSVSFNAFLRDYFSRA
ncbi:glutamate--cysteine ligase [Pseudoalteromonas ardens]|uniref:Glutamate--cysteine ligase n=1 Tax=Pseudoalteromonas rubra TaxID=43658 RepID=A0A0L0ENB4_9GAMM|nr:glutamate--cysteine ligase [Pseudoalteromonas sp. R96]KNC65398.1 glutamate--cysteine ligase [Pseudoalteromonas rubra]MDK1311546.1 glutamate--cysteine ligase [Pseudoalteromonas sp. R96]